MISFTSTSLPTDPSVLDSPGGFAWWYVDLVDEAGDGVVVIWSFGLPFLPGYASAARAGRAPTPKERPSVTVSVYKGGSLAYYHLQEHAPDDVSWNPAQGRWRFGRTTFAWTDTPSAAGSGGRATRRLDIHLDDPIPGCADRLTGHIWAEGPLRQDPGPSTDSPAVPPDPRHQWCPMVLTAAGGAELAAGQWSFSLKGRAYHDRNAGPVPMHALGIGRWWWGRLAFPDREVIWYRLLPEDGGPLRELVVDVDASGHTRTVERPMSLGPDVAGRFGLSSPSSIEFEDADGQAVVVETTALVDDGPFYQRTLVRGLCSGIVARGIAELVVPDQVDLDIHRPFVRMRVHHLSGPNSLFLPLFTGPRAGRVGRLPHWWAPNAS